MCVHTGRLTHTNMNESRHTATHCNTHTNKGTHTYTCAHMSTLARARLLVLSLSLPHTHTYTHAHRPAYTNKPTCKHAHTRTTHMHTHTRTTHTHTHTSTEAICRHAKLDVRMNRQTIVHDPVIKRNPHMSKATYICQQRPVHVKRDRNRLGKRAFECVVKQECTTLYSKETYIFEKRRIRVKIDLHMSKKTYKRMIP